MKGTVKLWCGILFVAGGIFSSVIFACALGRETSGGDVVNTTRAILCTAIALLTGALAVCKRHMGKQQG